MMRFHEDMYIAPSIKNADKVKRGLRLGRGSLRVYVMVLNHDSKKLEFFHNGMLKQRVLRKRDMDIVGLAGNSKECIWLTELMLDDAYNQTGSYDVYGYLSSGMAGRNISGIKE